MFPFPAIPFLFPAMLSMFTIICKTDKCYNMTPNHSKLVSLKIILGLC